MGHWSMKASNPMPMRAPHAAPYESVRSDEAAQEGASERAELMAQKDKPVQGAEVFQSEYSAVPSSAASA